MLWFKPDSKGTLGKGSGTLEKLGECSTALRGRFGMSWTRVSRMFDFRE